MAALKVGNVVRIIGTFQQSSVNADPAATITYRAKAPDQSETVQTCTPGLSQNGIVRDAMGIYHYDQLVTEAGDWYCSFEAAAGTGQGFDETVIQVGPRHT
jgi:hypothetical protein